MSKYEYEVVPDVFPRHESTSSSAVPLAAGGWRRLRDQMEILIRDAPPFVCYKLLYFHRHGQGVHNLAAKELGYDEWLRTWARRDGDGQRVWRDAELTDVGRQQAQTLNRLLREQHDDGMPHPQSFYTSPLTRTLSTLELVWNGLIPDGVRPQVVEELRECVNMICELQWSGFIDIPVSKTARELPLPYWFTEDRRGNVSDLRERFPAFDFRGVTGEDEMWKTDYNETRDQQLERTQRFLDAIFSSNSAACVAISSHGGWFWGLAWLLNAEVFSPKPCQFVPFLVKATRRQST